MNDNIRNMLLKFIRGVWYIVCIEKTSYGQHSWNWKQVPRVEERLSCHEKLLASFMLPIEKEG